MSMSCHVIGIKEPTEEYLKKYRAYQACMEAGIDPPKAIIDFFDGISFKYINATGMEVDLHGNSAISEWKGDGKTGFEVEIAKIPAGITRLRFCNSW
jgi:hypothetical protein